MSKRRPSHVVYTRTVYYGGGRRPSKKQWPWLYLIAGVVALAVFPREPVVAMVIVAGLVLYWRKQHGRGNKI